MEPILFYVVDFRYIIHGYTPPMFIYISTSLLIEHLYNHSFYMKHVLLYVLDLI